MQRNLPQKMEMNNSISKNSTKLLYKFIKNSWFRNNYATVRFKYRLSIGKINLLLESMLKKQSPNLYSSTKFWSYKNLDADSIKKYQDAKKNPKIVIYSAIVGNYDYIKYPYLLDSRIDYVLFTDQKINGQGIYDVRPLPYIKKDAARQVRYPKTHPHILFTKYDIAIWIDASLQIVGDIYPMIDKFIESKKAVACIPHSFRNSIYEEGEACIALGKDNAEIINNQLNHYRKEGFNQRELATGGLLMYNLRNKKTATFLNHWWLEIINFSRRDQLSLTYCLYKNGIEWHRLMKRPQHAGNHPIFALAVHNKNKKGTSK